MANFIDLADNLDGLALELGIVVHNVFWGAPEHVAYALIEAENIGAISRFVFSFPFRQDFKVTPVQDLKAIVVTGKAMLAKMQG